MNRPLTVPVSWEPFVTKNRIDGVLSRDDCGKPLSA